MFVVYPGITLLGLAGALQVFNDACYETAVVSLRGGKIETDTLIPIYSVPISVWEAQTIHTLIVLGGDSALAVSQDHEFVTQVTGLIRKSGRVCSVCSGAFVLGATGVLNNRRVTTHWSGCGRLAETFPDVQVEMDPIFLKDGNVWTSAGVTAGLDLALALVAEDLGRSQALRISRSLVAYMVRPGGQSQFSSSLSEHLLNTSSRFKNLHEWIAENLHRDLQVDQLAEHVNMSPRNFARVYTSETGQTPAKSVEALRTEVARQLLESTALPVKEIAVRCGFIDDERMRRAFVRKLQIFPTDYRRRFQI